MTTFLIITGLLFLILVVYLSTLDGDYHIDRSLLINAPLKDCYDAVVDFKSWPKWSPWLLHEPETSLIYSDNYQQENGYYSWDGKMVGAGKLTHLSLNPLTSIQQKIEFIRPFKSVCSVSWTFKEVDGKTEVHWLMSGSMPFFFRFMTKMTVSMINKDYDLGLILLNGYLDKTNAHPLIQFVGSEQLESFKYAFHPFKGFLKEKIETTQAAIPELIDKTQQAELTAGLPVTIYHKADPEKKYFECDIAIPVNKESSDKSLPMANFAGGRYYRVNSQGSYKFLELSWYKTYSHIKMLKLKLDKSRPALEVYENSPDEVDNSNELMTALYLPIK